MQSGIQWCPHCGKPHKLNVLVCPASGRSLQRGVTRPEEVSHPLIGAVIDGRYRVLRVLGKGGLGIVFEAENTAMRRLVAIKVSVDQRRWESLERLSREAQFVASLQHPNICDIFDFGWLPTYGPYIVTERLFGESLAVRRHRRRMLTLTETIEITNQILCGLHAAHGRQIIHRDLKPRNVFLVDRINCAPLVKILDFGLARDLTMSDSRRLTRPGQALGTYGYMSPEQLKGESPTVRSDLFAVGIMAYEMLAGVHPFAGESQADMAASIMHDPTPPLGRGGREGPKLEQVLGRALAKEPLSRFPDAVAFQRALLELHAQSYVDDSEPLSDTGSG